MSAALDSHDSMNTIPQIKGTMEPRQNSHAAAAAAAANRFKDVVIFRKSTQLSVENDSTNSQSINFDAPPPKCVSAGVKHSLPPLR
jgi:hypothetical protein